jgi:hypothetical protein
MLKKIAADDPIWENPPFSGEKVLFNLLYRLREYDDPLIVTDRENIFATQTSPGMPAWIWTNANADPEDIRALCSAYGITKVTAKESTLCALSDWQITHRLMASECKRLIAPAHVGGRSDRPDASELSAIAVGIAGFHLDAMKETIDAEEAIEVAERYMQNEDFVIWRTKKDEIAAFALISHRTDTHARISRVYAYPNFRGNGYAGVAVAVLCKRIFAEGLTPMLYTDALYPSSNRAYQKIGFVPAGRLATVEKQA